jgi:hypothetical protein
MFGFTNFEIPLWQGDTTNQDVQVDVEIVHVYISAVPDDIGIIYAWREIDIIKASTPRPPVSFLAYEETLSLNS